MVQIAYELLDEDRVLRVALRGEADVMSTPEMRRRLEALDSFDFSMIVLDLSELGFLSGAAMGALVGFRSHLNGRGEQLRLVAPSARVRRELERVRLDDVFEIHPTLADATRPR